MLFLHVANDREEKEPSCLCQASPVIRGFVYPFVKTSPCDFNTFCKALSANAVELGVHGRGELKQNKTLLLHHTALNLAW